MGPKLTRLAFGVLGATQENAAAHVVLQRLVQTVGETCNIGTLINGEVVYLDRVEADHWPLRLQFTTGSRVPLHCTAIGKLFLALAPALRRRRVLQCIDLKAHTERTITRLDALESELRAIRKEQVSFDREEFLIGVVCAAVPIIGRNGEILAALAIQGPEARMNLESARARLPALRRAARDLAEIFQAQETDQDVTKTKHDRPGLTTMKMTTEEAFVKVLQMHGIEHAFGIIGSAFMPISDLFPAGRHHLLGRCARDQWRADLRRLSRARPARWAWRSRRTVRVSPTSSPPIKTAYWNHTPMLLVTPQAANKTIGQGGFQEVEQMALFQDMVCYQEEVRDPSRVAEVLNRVIAKAWRRSAPAQINMPRDFWTQVIDIDLPQIVEFERPAGGDDAHRRGGQAPVGAPSSRSS